MRQDSPSSMLLPVATIALIIAMVMPDQLAADASTYEVKTLITDLEDDSFDLRESATRQLVLLGSAAVDALGAAAINGSPEVSWRAVYALGEIAVAGDFDKRNTAEDTLDKLKSSINLSAADRAKTILETLPESRQVRAIAMIRSLGGIIDESGTQLRLDEKWTGGDSGLRYVKHVAELRSINIEPHTAVSEAGIDKLRTAMPDVRIVHYGTAFLGVGAASNEGGKGMFVLTVQADSPADKGGIVEGDVIQKIDNIDINGFEDLVTVMRKRKVGDTVEVVYTRTDPDTGEQRDATTKVKLGARPGTELPPAGK